MAYKIRYGRNTTKLTNEQHLQRIKDAHSGNVVALSGYINNRTFVRYKCIKHNYEWDGRPSMVMSGSTSCPECRHERRIEISSDTLESVKEKIYKKYGNEYELLDTEYKGYKHKMNFIHHLKDGRKHILYSTVGRVLSDVECPVCCGQQIAKGFNDIATLDPEIASWFANKNETYIYTCHSNKKVDFICPICGYRLNKSINQVSKDRDLRCPVCKDGISYPNKFMFNSLLQIENRLDFLEREYNPNWCRFHYKDSVHKGIYDIYFGIDGNKYIIEMDGGFHNKDNQMNGQTVEDSRYIDHQKDLLAKEHNIKVIRIDSDYIDFEDRYEFLMKNIKDSELKNILPIDLINFDESNIKSQKSLLIEACKLWDCGYKAFEIVDELHIHKSSLSRYLKTGQKYGLCHEYSTKNSSARSIGRKVVCVNTAEIFNTIKDAEEYYNVNGIGNCCEGKTYSAGKHKETNEKLYWLFYEDYQQMSEDDIKKFLLNKLEYERINENFGKAVVCITTGEEFMTATDASIKYNISDSGIRFCCQHKIDTSGQLNDGTRLRWVYWSDYIKMTKEEIEALKHSTKSREKRVVCLNTHVVFNNATIAGKWCGVAKNTIRKSALNERVYGGRHPKTGEQLKWIYYEDYIKQYDVSTLITYQESA